MITLIWPLATGISGYWFWTSRVVLWTLWNQALAPNRPLKKTWWISGSGDLRVDGICGKMSLMAWNWVPVICWAALTTLHRALRCNEVQQSDPPTPTPSGMRHVRTQYCPAVQEGPCHDSALRKQPDAHLEAHMENKIPTSVCIAERSPVTTMSHTVRH